MCCTIIHAPAGMFCGSLISGYQFSFCLHTSFFQWYLEEWESFSYITLQRIHWLCHQNPWIFGKNESEIFQWCNSTTPQKNKQTNKQNSVTSNISFGRGWVHQPYFWCTQDGVCQTVIIQSSWTGALHSLSRGGLRWEGCCSGMLPRWRPSRAWRPPAAVMNHRAAWNLFQSSWELDPGYYAKVWIHDVFSFEGNNSLFYLLILFFPPHPRPGPPLFFRKKRV